MGHGDTEVLGLNRHLQITLDSYRLNHFLGDGSLPHLVLGPLAERIGDCQATMDEFHQAGRDDWFEAAGGQRWFERRGEELRLHDDLYFPGSWSVVDDDLQLGFRDGVTRERWSIPLDAASLAVFGELVTIVRTVKTTAEWRACLSPDMWSFIEHLETHGVLVRLPVSPPRQRTDYRVTLVGHSCLLVESPGTRILVDPLLTLRDRPRLQLGRLLETPLDAVVISHPHWDHCNLDTLFLIDRRTPLVVPRLRHRRSIVNVDIGALCRQLGFQRVETLAPWESTTVGDIEVGALPYYGEGSGPEGHQDWMTYFLGLGGKVIVGFVDACRDTFGSMDDVARQVRAERGDVDLLFAPVSDFWFRTARYFRRPFRMGAEVEQFTGSAHDCLRWMELTGAHHVAPYAMFLYDDQGADSPTATFLDAQRGRYDEAVALLAYEHPGAVHPLRPGEALRWHRDGPMRPVTR